MKNESPYNNRELDAKFAELHDKLDDMKETQAIELGGIKNTQKEMLSEVRYTNGKVRKIIVALVALAFFSLGLGLTNAGPIIGLISAL